MIPLATLTRRPPRASLDGPVDAGPLSLLIVQPTPFCNIDCDYCYLRDRSNTSSMSQETLDAIFRCVFQSQYVSEAGFSVVWHAGEPLVLPLSFYRSARAHIDLHNARDVPIRVNFQTNGMLISDEWCEFFRDSGAQLGVSLDGPKTMHDRHRKTRNGRGTFDQVMAGIEHLKRYQIPFSVICVLTADSLARPDEMFAFFREHGIRTVGFNIEEFEGQSKPSSVAKGSGYGIFRSFLERFMECNKDGSVDLRELRSFRAALSLRDPAGFSEQCRPMRIVTVDWQGGMSTFSPELHGIETPPYGPFVFANAHSGSLDDILTSDRFKWVYSDIKAGVAACEKECEYYGVCGGGAPANKYFENGSLRTTETMYCQTRVKAMTDVLLPRFEAEFEERESR